MHIQPKKSLGQNFLVDKNVQKKIVEAAGFRSSDVVLEIGAGRGELTALIAPRVKKVYAFEIDARLCDILKNSVQAYGNVQIRQGDVLKTRLRTFTAGAEQVKVIGNIPYYITTPLIEKVIGHRDAIEAAFFTVQKEFAERIVASSGSKIYGSLSCFVQYYMRPEILFPVSRNCFRPVPEVDSCFLKLDCRSPHTLQAKNETRLFAIIRRSFNQRRKTLRNSLKGIVAEKRLKLFFARYGIDPRIRPEELTLTDFVNLSNS